MQYEYYIASQGSHSWGPGLQCTLVHHLNIISVHWDDFELLLIDIDSDSSSHHHIIWSILPLIISPKLVEESRRCFWRTLWLTFLFCLHFIKPGMKCHLAYLINYKDHITNPLHHQFQIILSAMSEPAWYLHNLFPSETLTVNTLFQPSLKFTTKTQLKGNCSQYLNVKNSL